MPDKIDLELGSIENITFARGVLERDLLGYEDGGCVITALDPRKLDPEWREWYQQNVLTPLTSTYVDDAMQKTRFTGETCSCAAGICTDDLANSFFGMQAALKAFKQDYPRIYCPSCRKRCSPEGDSIDANYNNPTVRMVCLHCDHRWEVPRKSQPELLLAKKDPNDQGE